MSTPTGRGAFSFPVRTDDVISIKIKTLACMLRQLFWRCNFSDALDAQSAWQAMLRGQCVSQKHLLQYPNARVSVYTVLQGRASANRGACLILILAVVSETFEISTATGDLDSAFSFSTSIQRQVRSSRRFCSCSGMSNLQELQEHG